MPIATPDIADVLRRRIDLASLIPEDYAAYRPLVVGGLIFFLERLPAHRLAAILSEQAAMPPDSDSTRRLVALLHHCPTLHKLGQVLARDRRLDPALRKGLQSLESLAPRTPLDPTLEIIRHDLGAPERHGITLATSALAEGSVAIVLPFAWHAPDEDRPVQGVFKVLKPGVRDRLHDELALWGALGDFLDEQAPRLNLPAPDYRETLDSVRDLLAGEVDLHGEQRHLEAARPMYATVPDLVIPRLLPFNSSRITAMQRLAGRKITDGSDLDARARARLARLIVRGLLAEPMWNHERESLVHADPHAGNLILTSDHRLGVLDWSLTAALSKQTRIDLTRLVQGALAHHRTLIAAALHALSRKTPEPGALTPVLDAALAELRPARLPDLHWFIRLLDRATAHGGVRLDPALLLFRKALHSLEGVLGDLDPGFDVDDVLRAEFLTVLTREWPARAWALPWDRSFPTHLSNADLHALLCALPLAAARAWMTP